VHILGSACISAPVQAQILFEPSTGQSSGATLQEIPADEL